MQKIIIGSDHGGFKLKAQLLSFLKSKGYKVLDIGTHSQEPCDYPAIAYNLARLVAEKKFERGILLCKSGIGDSIVANKAPGVRAALCYNLKAARLSREHNDANVLVMGGSFVKAALAKRITLLWLKTKFLGGRHLRRVKQIKYIETSITKNLKLKK